MKTQLSKLENVDIRSIWKNEASDFTPWLARPENINRVGDAIGMDLTVIEDEKRVGPFKADIFCKDENSDNLVVIENQLEATNHNHLGQILTYASGLNAASIVWIASEFEDEHRAVLDWLNEHTEPEINFFGVRLEVVKINESPVAPNFKVISQPNNWTKSTNNSGYRCYGKLTENLKLMQDFWTHLNAQIVKNKSFLGVTRPRAQNWHSFRLGTSGSHLSAEINNRDKIFRARVNIPNDLTLYEGLKHNRREIEKEFGETLDWQDLDGCKASKIIIYKDNCHLNKEDQWEIYSNWFIENLEKFYQIFSPKIKQLKNGEHQLRIN
jgi:hypothetical protein|tara:strand:+ start:146 stop:1120 length:975 start_codon:yes stop_codon:yes gene_type:complete